MHKLTGTRRSLGTGMRAAIIVAAVLAIGATVPHTARAQHGGGWHGGGWHGGGGHGGGWYWRGGGWWWGPAAVAGLYGAALAYPYYYGYPYGYPYPYAYPYPPQASGGAPAYYPPQASGAAPAYYPPQASGAAPGYYPPQASEAAPGYYPPPAPGSAPAAGTPGAPQAGAAITYTNRPAFRDATGQTCREYQANGALGTACQDSSGQWRVAN
jgi:hypothetical protein